MSLYIFGAMSFPRTIWGQKIGELIAAERKMGELRADGRERSSFLD